MEKWFVINKGADFEKLGKEFGISPVTARLIRNREVIGEAAFERYLYGSLKDLYDPHLLKDADRLTDILKVKIEEQKPIRIIGDEVYITNIRHKTSLQEALRSLHLVLQSIADDMPEDFYSIDLMNAYEELGNIIGESVEDDLVNEIFSKFCMGK